MNGRQPCETCDFIGPELPTLQADARTFHRAMHNLGRALEWALASMLERLSDRLGGRR